MQDTSNTSRPSRPWLKITLFVSLALNLLIVGLVAGLAFSKSPRDRSPLLRDLGYGPFMQALPRSDKRQIIETLRSREGSFRENRAEFRREFDAFLTVLRSDPLDDAELRRVVDNQRNRM